MIEQAQSRLPESVTVVLLGDRGFVHTELMTMLTTQLGWHYRIRIKSPRMISEHDPTSAIASLQQNEQRLYQLKFQVQTYSYNVC